MKSLGWGYFLCSSRVEMQINQQQPNPHLPTLPQAVGFFDGQNLYRSAKRVYGYIHPNYDPQKLAQQICGNQRTGLLSVVVGKHGAGDRRLGHLHDGEQQIDRFALQLSRVTQHRAQSPSAGNICRRSAALPLSCL